MSKTPNTQSDNQNFLSDILGEAGKPKVKLTPEIEQEIREHLAEAQARAERGEPMTRETAEFMENVRLWVGMPEWWRQKNPTINQTTLRKDWNMLTPEVRTEAKTRDITPWQWLDLLYVAESLANYDRMSKEQYLKQRLDKTFEFPGRGEIVAKETLNLEYRNLTHLPDGLKIKRDLWLEGCKNLTSLPEGLEVEYELNLRDCSGLTHLPKELKVGGDFYLDGCTGLTELPEGLKVENGLLNLNKCKSLTRLPKGLEVERELFLVDCTGLTELPENLKANFLFLKGCVGLQQNKTKVLRHLSENIKNMGVSMLNLADWPLEDGDLPENLGMKGELVLGGCTKLTKLPKGLGVPFHLNLYGCTGLTELPDGLKVENNLNLVDCTGLTWLPEGLEVGKDLYLSKNLHEQVKKDAERLKKEGKIKGKIYYQ